MLFTTSLISSECYIYSQDITHSHIDLKNKEIKYCNLSSIMVLNTQINTGNTYTINLLLAEGICDTPPSYFSNKNGILGFFNLSSNDIYYNRSDWYKDDLNILSSSTKIVTSKSYTRFLNQINSLFKPEYSTIYYYPNQYITPQALHNHFYLNHSLVLS